MTERWMAGVILMLSLCTPPAGSQPAPSPGGSPGPDVKLVLGADRLQLGTGDTLALWLTFENRSASSVSSLRARQLEVGTFTFADDCWHDGLPDCVLNHVGARPEGVLSPALAAGQVVVARARLRAGAPGTYALQMAYSWIDERGTERQAVASLGPLLVSNPPAFLALSNPLLPPVVAGVVVALLGAALAFIVKRRELDRAEVQQTWNTMLKDSHDTAQKYYLPFCGAMMRFAAQGTTAPTQAAREEAFYNFLCILQASRRVFRGVGGLFLKDRLGEQLAFECWRHFKLAVEVELGGRDKLDAALDCVPRDLRSFARFRSKLAQSGSVAGLVPLHSLFPPFCTWFDAMPADQRQALLSFNEILLYEMNRPLERWYGAPQDFPAASLGEYATGLRKAAEVFGRSGSVAREKALSGLASGLDRYLAQNQKRR